MSRLGFSAVFLIVLCAGSTANAAASVWFGLVSGSASACSQGEGEVLRICGSGPGTYDLEIAMYARITDVGIYGTNTTLAANTDSLITSMTMIPPPGGIELTPSGLNTPGPGDIATNFGGATFSGPGYLGNDVLLGTFNLRAVLDVLDETRISARVGTGLWGQSDATAPLIRFADGAYVDGGTSGNGLRDVIVVYQFPEPTTLGLLGIACLGLVRRRRA